MKITKEMLKNFKASIDAWRERGDNDTDMKKVYAQDRKQLRSVYNYCKKSELKRAAHIAYWLDTVVRDQIPNDLYDILFP